jgi:hypothetical protein
MRAKILGSALFLAALAQPACASRLPLVAPEARLGNVVQVRTFDAFVKGDRVYVKLIVLNVSGQPLIVDRDGFALRLPTGEVLQRSSGVTTQHTPYPLAPGAGRDVFVDFRAPHELESMPSYVLVVGGVSVGADPAPRVVGEIPLAHVGAP